jgi:hypothetical protein
MKLNKKKLNGILSQIKSHLDVAIMMDTPEHPGLIDFLFQPKAGTIISECLNKLTCDLGNGDDLFADSVIETLGSPIIVSIARLRDVLKTCEFELDLKDGVINGVNIQVSTDIISHEFISLEKGINANWDDIKKFDFSGSVKFAMSQIDYELVVNTMRQFVSLDTTRYFMCGYDIDFRQGDDFINFVATDGKRMAICKFPCKYSKGDSKWKSNNPIFMPSHLFIPESAYSQVQWWVNECAALIRIQTENYSIDCWGRAIDGKFPNYLRIISGLEQNEEWISLSARSVRKAVDSTKGLINNSGRLARGPVLFDAEDPKYIKLTISGATVNVEGEASRPMRFSVEWSQINSVFMNTPFTKFWFKNARSAFFTKEVTPTIGATVTVTKVAISWSDEDNTDEWGIVKLNQQAQAINDDTEKLDIEDSENSDISIRYSNN